MVFGHLNKIEDYYDAYIKPVGEHHPLGDSFFQVYDLAGNVQEWTNSIYSPYPYDANDGRENLDIDGLRTVRGGGFHSMPAKVRSAFRFGANPRSQGYGLGFRVIRDTASVSPP